MAIASSPSRQILSGLPLFCDLTPSQIAQARKVLRTSEVPANHLLMTEEQPGDDVFVIARGAVKICTRVSEGTVMIAVRGPGEVVGEMSVIGGVGHSATVITCEPSFLLQVSRTDFWSVLWEMPPIPYNLACLLAQRVRVLTSQLLAIASPDIKGRLAGLLLTLVEENGLRCPSPELSDGTKIPFQLSADELACMVGGTRAQISRWLAAWTREGLIAREDGCITVCQRDALQAMHKTVSARKPLSG